jgi:phosphohistidine phosphatase
MASEATERESRPRGAKSGGMKTITILRHAKSSWDDPVARDFDRGLNARGERASLLIGEAAAKEDLGIDAIISSPAVRCTETLDHFQPAAGIPDMEPHWDRRVYLASSATLLDLLHETPDTYGHVLLCGHNPGLEDLILELVPDDGSSPLRDVVEDKLPTAALATLKCPVDHWRDLKPRSAALVRLILPRNLDPALGPED